MPYKLPTFNLKCNVWKQYDVTQNPPVGAPTYADVPCNLQYAKKFHGNLGPAVHLLVPKGTNVQDYTGFNENFGDIVECPAGTKRWYAIETVDDVSKGFETEYRACTLRKITDLFSGLAVQAWFWPVPYP